MRFLKIMYIKNKATIFVYIQMPPLSDLCVFMLRRKWAVPNGVTADHFLFSPAHFLYSPHTYVTSVHAPADEWKTEFTL